MKSSWKSARDHWKRWRNKVGTGSLALQRWLFEEPLKGTVSNTDEYGNIREALDEPRTSGISASNAPARVMRSSSSDYESTMNDSDSCGSNTSYTESSGLVRRATARVEAAWNVLSLCPPRVRGGAREPAKKKMDAINAIILDKEPAHVDAPASNDPTLQPEVDAPALNDPTFQPQEEEN
ncbi:unnamed protein product [Haemonchus placei]|uniref:Uncharacterized protein n=1 Tax=Haemonchus placei TaxID=6290 RepID=A0A0N4WVK3_HAEPC|nr:unnamed protein product [Haemonchus placei]